VEKSINDVPTDELNQFIETMDTEAPIMAVAGKTDEIRELIKNVSDKEMLDFLSDTEAPETISN
jgi:hypothetical protein